MYLLYVDLLGVKARWEKGATHAQRAFKAFEGFVISGLSAVAAKPTGGIDSDAAALVFPSGEDALEVARSIYLAAFASGPTEGDERYWLRGVLLTTPNSGLRESKNLKGDLGHITKAQHSPALLKAITVENSGKIKGMRLLVSESACTPSLGRRATVKVAGKPLHTLTKLSFTGYPAFPKSEKWRDFLWMAPADQAEWKSRTESLRNKMRWSVGDPAEFAQVAATQVVFDECRAIMGSQKVPWAG